MEETHSRLAKAAFAASVAEALTFPMDLVKTRFQLETSAQRGWRGKVESVAQVVRERGYIRGFYSGSPAAILRHVPYTATRIATFEGLRERLGHEPRLLETLAIGFSAGAIGQFVSTPFDVVKIRLISDASKAPHLQRYHGVWDAFVKIYSEKGVLGMWKGSSIAVQRAALVNLGELSTYDVVKRKLIQTTSLTEDDSRTHILSSLSSGFCSSFISTPADVLKTRMMNDTSRSYSSSIQCLKDCVSSEGIRGLYKGFFPTWARLGPWQLTFWVVYERLKAIHA